MPAWYRKTTHTPPASRQQLPAHLSCSYCRSEDWLSANVQISLSPQNHLKGIQTNKKNQRRDDRAKWVCASVSFSPFFNRGKAGESAWTEKLFSPTGVIQLPFKSWYLRCRSTYHYALKRWMNTRSLFDLGFMPAISLTKNSAVTQLPATCSDCWRGGWDWFRLWCVQVQPHSYVARLRQ